ncbi:MAG: methyltransferase domain-containing protein [candidate division Zixibacteria bacterium]|nr:methyltransferase domain-containing protein [candidate division Zixibacteria bacterium]
MNIGLSNIQAVEKQADKIIAVCRHFSQRPLDELTCLYLGNLPNPMSERLAANFKRVVVLDFFGIGPNAVSGYRQPNNIDYINSDRVIAALADDSADLVICDRVYEHIPNSAELVSEIYRVLKYDGFCYFAADNRYLLIDHHYSLPFLSWMPRPLASLYLRLAGRRGKYNLRLLSLRKLQQLTGNFWRHDYTGLILENPEVFYGDDSAAWGRFVSHLPKFLYSLVYPLFPCWVWILTRKK